MLVAGLARRKRPSLIRQLLCVPHAVRASLYIGGVWIRQPKELIMSKKKPRKRSKAAIREAWRESNQKEQREKQKRKRASQQEHATPPKPVDIALVNPNRSEIPDNQILSSEPNETLGWCANCQAHTYPGTRTVIKRKDGYVISTYRLTCCRNCESSFSYNIPSVLRQGAYQSCGCAAVAGPILLGSLYWSWWSDFRHSYIVTTFAAILLTFIMGCVTMFLYQHTQWRNWVKRQSQQSPPTTG